MPQLVHEVAHAVVAGTRGIKIAPSLLIPNSQLGTFGSVTQVGVAAACLSRSTWQACVYRGSGVERRWHGPAPGFYRPVSLHSLLAWEVGAPQLLLG